MVLLLRNENRFFDIFKQWFPGVKFFSEEKFVCLQANNRKKFISNTLKLYCQERNIKIGYTALYIHKKKWDGQEIMKNINHNKGCIAYW